MKTIIFLLLIGGAWFAYRKYVKPAPVIDLPAEHITFEDYFDTPLFLGYNGSPKSRFNKSVRGTVMTIDFPSPGTLTISSVENTYTPEYVRGVLTDAAGAIKATLMPRLGSSMDYQATGGETLFFAYKGGTRNDWMSTLQARFR